MGALRRNLVFDKYAGKNRVTTNPYHSGGHVSGTDRRRVSAALAALLSFVGHDDEYQKDMPMLVNLYSREWLQTYSREVEMHIYKEGDQITAQSPECKWGHEGEDVSSDFPRRLPCPPSAWHPGPRLYPWLTRSMEVRTPTRNLRKSVPSKSSRNRFINF